MASYVIFQYNVLAIDDTHNTWTNMIVKMNILRLLGSSDDKEKIGVATEVIYVGALADEDRGNYIHRLNQRCIDQLHRFSCPERCFLEEREEVTITG